MDGMQIFRISANNADVGVLAYKDKFLCGMSVNGDHPLEWRKYFIQKVPTQLESTEMLEERFPRSTIEEVLQEPYFDEFWEKYDYKHDKIMALKQWDKMKPVDRVAAYINVERYERHLKRSKVGKLYAVRYLQRRTWENDLGK